MLSIDLHVHVLQEDVAQLAAGHTVLTGFGQRESSPSPSDVERRRRTQMLDPTRLLEALDDRRTDLAVVSSALVVQTTSWAERTVDRWAHQKANDHIAGLAQAYPSRIIGSFSLPLRHRGDAEQELHRACEDLDLHVLNIPVEVDGVYIGEPGMRWLWELADEHGLLVFLHPEGVRDPWYQQFGLWNSIGQPIEEAKALSSLIYGGVLEDYPDLAIVVAHGGGYLPHYMGRHDRNWHNMPESAANISRLPSSYLRNLYFDTVVYDPGVVDALARRVGVDRLVMGSDAPFGEDDPIGFLDRTNLTADEQQLVIGVTAARLLAEAGSLPVQAAELPDDVRSP